MSVIKAFGNDITSGFSEEKVTISDQSPKQAFVDAEFAMYEATLARTSRRLPRKVRDDITAKRAANQMVAKFRSDVLPQIQGRQAQAQAAKLLAMELGIEQANSVKALYRELGVSPKTKR